MAAESHKEVHLLRTFKQHSLMNNVRKKVLKSHRMFGIFIIKIQNKDVQRLNYFLKMATVL